jgi:hypothetical protein
LRCTPSINELTGYSFSQVYPISFILGQYRINIPA